jgi:CHAD domain-containing protein
LPADQSKGDNLTFTRASYRRGLRRAEKVLAKRVSAYIRNSSEKNVHDLRTATRRLLAAAQILPKKLRNVRKFSKYTSRLEKLMKLNAKTRDLDIVIAKVSQRSRSSEHDSLLKQLRDLRDSSVKPGVDFARSLKGDLEFPVRTKDLSGPGLKRRFDKVSGKYMQKVEKRLPTVVDKPEEKKELHLLREDVRRLRYTLNLGQGDIRSGQLKQLKSWQDALGKIHDSDIFIQYFDESEKTEEVRSLLDDETVVRNRFYEKFKMLAKVPLKLAS